MRSHVVVLGGLVTVLVVLAVGHWQRQRAIQAASTAVSSPAMSPTQTIAAPPTTWPGVSESTPATVSVDPQTGRLGNAAISTVANRETSGTVASVGGMAVVTAQDPNAEVNVRSLPSSNADSLGYGMVGDTVTLGRSEAAEDGHTWHYVTFQDTSTTGWIRSDFLDILPNSAVMEEDSVAFAAPGLEALE
ncbi:MAG: SH3 domain-containing protein, partial [Cyanobacteria bacterium J06559_3]